jgi:hypothetical protein
MPEIGPISDPFDLMPRFDLDRIWSFRAGCSSVSDGQHEQIQADYQSLVRFG